MEAINGIIEAVVRERLKGSVIESVRVEHDTDSDGDPVLRITVVFDSVGGDLDASKLVSMVRHLRPKLEEEYINTFPMFRFLSKTDAVKIKYAAA